MSDWKPIVKSGDAVITPHGMGTLRRVSEINGTAQVDVGGQLFEVPLAQVSKAGDGTPRPDGKPQPKMPPVFPSKVKKGDRVKHKINGLKGKVTEVTQRTVKVKYDVGGNQVAYNKKDVGKHLEQDQGEQPDKQPDNAPFKVGDKVRLKADSKFVGQIPDWENNEGTVTDVAGVDAGLPIRIKSGDYSNSYSPDDLEKIEGETKPEQEQTPEEKKVTDTGDGLYEILKLKEHLEKKIEDSVDGELKELKEQVKKRQKLEVKSGDKVNVVEGLKHMQLEQLITYAMMRLSPLLVGMAGTGKTHAGEQTAKALGLDFYAMSVGAQTSKSDIIGYMAANGDYVKTHFRDAYEKGGVFLMDEIDAGNANVLIQINAALSNGLCAFPDKMVERHKDFVFIASANTFGNGANRQYVGRNQLDAATLDRFAVIEWFIDDELESNLTVGVNGKAWYMAVRAARDYVAEKNIRALISPRATQKGSKLLHVGQGLDEVINATMLASVPEDKKTDVKQVAVTVFEKFASEVPSEISKAVNPEVSELIR